MMPALVQLLRTIFSVQKNLRTQQLFLRLNMLPLLHNALLCHDGSLDETDIQKITHYYGLAVPAILAEAFCVLHGKEMLQAERWASTFQGAMTGLFDDFFDKGYLTESTIRQKLSNKENAISKKQNEQLFDTCYSIALKNVADPSGMIQRLEAVFEAQVESKKQTSTNISEPEIRRITKLKGGCSLLFYRTSIIEKLSTDEEDMLFHCGALMQLCNDIFDIYKDRESGIQTLSTISTDIHILQKEFESLLLELKKKIMGLSFPSYNKRKFFQIIQLAVFSRTAVCLQQLIQVQQRHNGFNLHQLSRKELICDMDTTSNKWRSAWYCLK